MHAARLTKRRQPGLICVCAAGSEVWVVGLLQFLPQCNNVAIMNEGEMVYFGPWNKEAQYLLNEYLPVAHLLAAAGGAEQPKPKAAKKAAPAPARRRSSRKDLKKEKVSCPKQPNGQGFKPRSMRLSVQECLSYW